MRNYILVALIICIAIISCNKDKPKDDEIVYLEDLSELDSGALVRIVDKDGNVIRDDFASSKNNIWMESSDLNGDIFYDFVSDSSRQKTKIRAFKYDYRTEYFSVDMNNDTIPLGDEFVGYIGFEMKNGNRAIIDTEDRQVIIKESIDQNASSDYQVYQHKVDANDTGTYDFKGKIVIGEEEFPFEYKYVVIAKDTIDQGL